MRRAASSTVSAAAVPMVDRTSSGSGSNRGRGTRSGGSLKEIRRRSLLSASSSSVALSPGYSSVSRNMPGLPSRRRGADSASRSLDRAFLAPQHQLAGHARPHPQADAVAHRAQQAEAAREPRQDRA